MTAVVDLDGVRQAMLRGNGADPLDNAFYKRTRRNSPLARKEERKASRRSDGQSPATTVPQTPLPNVTYAVGG